MEGTGPYGGVGDVCVCMYCVEGGLRGSVELRGEGGTGPVSLAGRASYYIQTNSIQESSPLQTNYTTDPISIYC